MTGYPVIPVRDCRWLDLNHLACMRRVSTGFRGECRKERFEPRMPCVVTSVRREGTGSSSVAWDHIPCGKRQPGRVQGNFLVLLNGVRQWIERKNANSSPN